MIERPRILFLFSDTGGGHRSAAEAIIESLENHHPNICQPILVDVFKDYAPTPFDLLPDSYLMMTSIPQAWELGFRVLDGQRRYRALTTALWPYIGKKVRQLVADEPADLIVSVHPLLIDPVLKALGKNKPRFITVVTDLVTGPATWYHPRVDLTIVPTKIARERALAEGLAPERVRVVGLPVAERFGNEMPSPEEIRRDLGWPAELPMVLLVGGAEGMGPLFETARAIARQGGPFGLAIVTGRNTGLRARLEAIDWEIPVRIHGFEKRMPQMMQLASLLVTKAGPGTITEALNAGLPIVLYSRIPGQEDGNVDFVESQGVGVWAPGPAATAKAVSSFMTTPEQLERASDMCRRIARPNAAREIADVIIANSVNGKAGINGGKPAPGS